MKLKQTLCAIVTAGILASCGTETKKEVKNTGTSVKKEFNYVVEQFADIKVLRYQIPGFEELSLQEKKLVYYLTQAGLSGRDIMWDQNYRHNLEIRKALETINTQYKGYTESKEHQAFKTYLKRVWFSNGIHHHYSNDKIKPEFSKEYLQKLLKVTNTSLSSEALEVIFNTSDAKKVNKKAGVDNVSASAINFYGPDITSKDVEDFYGKAYKGPKGKPIEAGLNSKLVR